MATPDDSVPPPLRLAQTFPPVPTEAWDEAIRRDLKDAGYVQDLAWHLDEGLAVQPRYRRDDVTAPASGPVPGVFPFGRGTGKTWHAVEPDALPTGAIRADRLHDAGAHAVQELAYAIAEGVDRLAAATDAGQDVDEAARGLAFVFGVGSTYFLEIAKLRAARLLWAQAVSAFAPADGASACMRLHVRTSRANKSLADPWTNLLRVTTEAMAAAIGGADTLAVEAFGFAPHLATNVPRILEHEAHLACVADPAGGSYYIETLTDALARAAWTLFQEVEADGGYARVLAAGRIEAALSETRVGRTQALAFRRRILVGVNDYPDLTAPMTVDATAPGDEHLPFGAERLAAPFERIRQRTARHARATGHTPRVLLLLRGDVAWRTARANFSLNLFGCAGFEVSSASALDEADLIVLCSSDAEYSAFAADVVPRTPAPVIVAGYPVDAVDALRAAGIVDFVHAGSNVLETLTSWQDRLGLDP